MSNAIKQSSVVVEAEEGTKVDDPKGGKNMKDWEKAIALRSKPRPSFYEDDNGKKFFISKGWSNDSLVRSLNVKLVESDHYDNLGEGIGATKTGNEIWGDYARPELLKRLRELGYQAIVVIINDGMCCKWIKPCDDDDYESTEDGTWDIHYGILYTRKDIDLKKYTELFNMNEEGSFVRILTSDWKISKAVPWIITDVLAHDNPGLSPYAIEELHRLGIKIQKAYKKLEWDE